MHCIPDRRPKHSDPGFWEMWVSMGIFRILEFLKSEDYRDREIEAKEREKVVVAILILETSCEYTRVYILKLQNKDKDIKDHDWRGKQKEYTHRSLLEQYMV
jgi:hypothetical protein